MKTRLTILAGATLGLLALGTSVAHAAPLPAVAATEVSASPAADVTALVAGSPSGKALLRLDGGTAYTKKTGKHAYKLVLPVDADIKWVGEVDGKGMRAGLFSHDGLVKGWSRLGHRVGLGVISTLTWGEEAVLVRVADPRVNAKGSLVFTTRTDGALPKKLPGFSLNVTRAEKATRFTDIFDTLALSNTTGLQATAGGDTSASVIMGPLDSNGNVSTACVSSANSGERAFNPNPLVFSKPKAFLFGPTTCGDVSFLSGAQGTSAYYNTGITYNITDTTNYEYSQITATLVFTTGKVDYKALLGQWSYGTNGTPACPIQGSTCPN